MNKQRFSFCIWWSEFLRAFEHTHTHTHSRTHTHTLRWVGWRRGSPTQASVCVCVLGVPVLHVKAGGVIRDQWRLMIGPRFLQSQLFSSSVLIQCTHTHTQTCTSILVRTLAGIPCSSAHCKCSFSPSVFSAVYSQTVDQSAPSALKQQTHLPVLSLSSCDLCFRSCMCSCCPHFY